MFLEVDVRSDRVDDRLMNDDELSKWTIPLSNCRAVGLDVQSQ